MPRRFSCPASTVVSSTLEGIALPANLEDGFFPPKIKNPRGRPDLWVLLRPPLPPPQDKIPLLWLTQRHADVGLAALSTQQHFERTPNNNII